MVPAYDFALNHIPIDIEPRFDHDSNRRSRDRKLLGLVRTHVLHVNQIKPHPFLHPENW